MLINGLFRDVNEQRVAGGLAVLTRAEFFEYMKMNAVPGSPAPPVAQKITKDQFINFITGL